MLWLLLMMMQTFFFAGSALSVHSADATLLFRAGACLLWLRLAEAWRRFASARPRAVRAGQAPARGCSGQLLRAGVGTPVRLACAAPRRPEAAAAAPAGTASRRPGLLLLLPQGVSC